MKTKNILLIIISMMISILISSCSSMGNIPLIPEIVKDEMGRQGFAVDKSGDVQIFRADGVKVTFYRKEMRIVIETEPESEDAVRSAK